MKFEAKTTLVTAVFSALIAIIATSFFFIYRASPNIEQAKNLVNQVIGGSGVIVNHFDGIGDLEGFVVESTANGSQSIVYTDKQGRYLISGMIIDSKGENISQADFSKYVAPERADLAFAALAQVSYLEEGSSKAAHQAYIVFDPNCIFCHRLYETLRPYVKSGQLAIRWIPVAFLKPTSKGRVYAILSSANPLAALVDNENNFNEQNEEGGIAPNNSPSAEIVSKLDKNMQFLSQSAITATPAVFYVNERGVKKLIMSAIDPKDMQTFVNSMGKSFH